MADIAVFVAGNAEVIKEERARRLKKSRKLRENPLKYLSQREVKEKYRLSENTLRNLTHKLSGALQSKTKRRFAMTPLLMISICLRFLAGDSYYHIVADTLLVSKASVSRAVHRVVNALCAIARQEIFLPSPTDLIGTKMSFKEIAGMPHVIGCVDGMFIRITKPTFNAHEYICRKGFPAINAQVQFQIWSVYDKNCNGLIDLHSIRHVL